MKEVDDADILFDQLMGDVVEPRRDFIHENTLQASVEAQRAQSAYRATRSAPY